MKLAIYEKMMLLALNDKEGTIPISTNVYIVLGTAIIGELFLNKKIKLVDKKIIEVIDETEIEDQVLKDSLSLIKGSKKKDLTYCYNLIVNQKNFYDNIAIKLCDKGILKTDVKKILLLFKQNVYPEINPEPERKINSKIRNAVIYPEGKIDEEMTIIISILKNCSLLNSVFNKDEIKQYKEKIEQICKGELVGELAIEISEAIQAAILLTVIIPATIITTTS